MPEGERTEAPTPRWLQEIRKRGDVVRSTEFNTAVGLLVGAVTLRFIGPSVAERMRETLTVSLLHPHAFSTDPDAIRFAGVDLALSVAAAVLPLLGAVMVAGIVSNLIQ